MGKRRLSHPTVHKDVPVYICASCNAYFTLVSEVHSKRFTGKSGDAILVNSAVNVMPGEREQRQLRTGIHVVCDIFCIQCARYLGWKYEYAFEDSEKYKIGKYILEKAFIRKIFAKDVPVG